MDDDLAFMTAQPPQSSAGQRPKSAPSKTSKQIADAESARIKEQKAKDNRNAFIGWLQRKEGLRERLREEQRRHQAEIAGRLAKEDKRIAASRERARQEAERQQLDARTRWSAVALQKQRLR